MTIRARFWQNWHQWNWWRLLLIIVLALGICFRLVNLDRKVYWEDEAATSLRISGYSKIEFVEQTYNAPPITVGELRQKYLTPNPSKNLGDTLQVLMGKAEHTPLYYLLARFWAQLVGSSPAEMRLLPALISLWAFPAIYWLCLELFGSPLIAGIAIALIAVSPLHILYAQEARQYSLWIVTILVSTAQLLRALRVQNQANWIIYAFTVIVGLYAHLFYLFIALSHGIYVLILTRLRATNQLGNYLVASTAALGAFTPWLLALFNYANTSPYWQSINKALGREITLDDLLCKWFRNVNRIFHEADLGLANLILFLFAAGAIYFVCRHASPKIWWLILTLFGVTALVLVLPDLIIGGQRSVRTRYLIPCALSIQLAVAYSLAIQLTISVRIWQQRIWRFVLTVLILGGVVSGAITSQAVSTWSKDMNTTKYYPRIAQAINAAGAPFVITDGEETNILSLTYLLKPDVKIQFLKLPHSLPLLDVRAKDIFLLDASEELRTQLQQEQPITLEAVVDKRKANLWRVKGS
ncbi:glycosyltransferase family 39 protein [[Phormidium] sp. ETS-05]|uniref:glycosyltransferase family 39 protein n=1 Tax=[Phormidium] sp. ETS-05 TaxID=222819 RepID=UPI0018EF2A47|nr:glycosyltransferase family 39 protein [[Phormidium] sp. ETS-05]